MNPLAISAFFAALCSLILAFFVFFKKNRDFVRITFTLLTLSFFIWIYGIGMEIIAPNKQWGLFWNDWLYSGAIFIPTFFIQFIQSYLHKINKRILIPCYFISVIFLIFNFTPLFVLDVVPKGQFNYASVPGILFPFFVSYFFSAVIYSFYLIGKEFAHSIGIRRNQFKFLILGTTIGFLGGSTNFLLVFDLFQKAPVGNYFISLGLFIFFYAIVKHRLMDINIVFTKGTTYLLLLLLLFIPSSILILMAQKIFFKEIHYLFSAVTIFLLLGVAFIFNKIKPKTEKAVEQLFFKNKYNYRDTIGQFSKAMVSILDIESLSKKIIETITQTMGVEKASLFLWDEEKGEYRLTESKGVPPPTPILSREDPLARYLKKFGEIIVREELAKGTNIPELKKVVETMSSLGAEVSIPFISREKLIGMMNLSHKFNKEIYSQEDFELLSALANQTAIAVENARLYEDLKKSKSYIRRADRLASLGTLTAGLAHEIRNPLVAIKTFTQLLPERLEDEEFRNQFLPIASNEVDRISVLINELLDFAKPSEPKFEFEDVNKILDGMILLVSTESRKKNIQIVKNFENNLPLVSLDREQMKQVFLNILLNAIEATPENGQITVKTRSFSKPGGDPYAQVEITDTGKGIPEEYLEDIFNPFFTTKSKGSGLGLSISTQIVQEHRGYISVESQVNKGTSFFINLPLKQEHPKRRRTDFENQKERTDSLGV